MTNDTTPASRGPRAPVKRGQDGDDQRSEAASRLVRPMRNHDLDKLRVSLVLAMFGVVIMICGVMYIVSPSIPAPWWVGLLVLFWGAVVVGNQVCEAIVSAQRVSRRDDDQRDDYERERHEHR